MKNFSKQIILISLTVISLLILTNQAKAQLKEGSIGAIAAFNGSAASGFLYTMSKSTELDVVVSVTVSAINSSVAGTDVWSDPSVGYGLGLNLRWFSEGSTIMPYWTAGAFYSKGGANLNIASGSSSTSASASASGYGVNAGFGGQAFMTKDIAIFAQLGLNVGFFNSTSTTSAGGTTVTSEQTSFLMNLGGSTLGCAIYF